MQLDNCQRESIDHQGYVVIPGVLDATMVARLHQAFDAPNVGGTQHVEITPATPAYTDWMQLPG